MPVYEWKRNPTKVKTNSGEEIEVWEYTTTHGPISEPVPVPEDDGAGQWQRVYTVGVGQVPGAGGSPARPARGKDGSS